MKLEIPKNIILSVKGADIKTDITSECYVMNTSYITHMIKFTDGRISLCAADYIITIRKTDEFNIDKIKQCILSSSYSRINDFEEIICSDKIIYFPPSSISKVIINKEAGCVGINFRNDKGYSSLIPHSTNNHHGVIKDNSVLSYFLNKLFELTTNDNNTYPIKMISNKASITL